MVFLFFQLYFDLEYKIAINPHVDGQEMLNKFKDILKNDLLNDDASFPYEIEKVEILDLDSSTEDKFSHHLIVNLYDKKSDPVLFLNNLQVGNYVKQFINRQLLTSRFGDNSDLSKFPFKLSDDKIFVDEAVYSKNRNFRTFLSSKFGKKSVLKKTNFSYDDEKFFFKVRIVLSDVFLILFY